MPLKDRSANKAYKRAYYLANRQHALAVNKSWAERNPEQAKENRKGWRQANPERAKLNSILAQRRLRDSIQISSDELRILKDMASGVCSYCLGSCATDLEHVIPVSRGGMTAYDNCVMACGSCNRRKGTRTPIEFLFATAWPLRRK